ncbi:hypothetical protein OESDEN_14654 [Oesophagostomum dentatum]|uniref:Uncharacterized protein n=1 Tax=Oesophagostomum dentatum TaxID=61180 RepID=A0A0B1SR08_OESDE|nr:hypothetical protein OESDEN_14654 [Oesophagostomum dentatum]
MKEAATQVPNAEETRVTRRIMAWPFYDRMTFLAAATQNRRYRSPPPKMEPECSPKLEVPCNSEKEEKQVKDNENALSVLEAFARDLNSQATSPPGDEWDILGTILQ